MKSSTRRRFLRNSSITATGLLLAASSGAKNQKLDKKAIRCAPIKSSLLFGSIASTKSGNWSDPSTWGGRLPEIEDTALISSGHTVTFDMATSKIAGVNVSNGGTLEFEKNKSATLESTRNIIIEGLFRINPVNDKVIHILRFVGIDESRFVGGGLDIIDSDTGLWVMGAGKLDFLGAKKTSWTRVTDSVGAGATSFSLKDNPEGWAEGDEIVLVPTDTPEENTQNYDDVRKVMNDKFAEKFEQRTISKVNNTSVTVTAPFSHNAHNKVVASSGLTWTAEILNLNRNVRIEGTATGKTHIFIRSSVPQRIEYCALRYMGPRKDYDGNRRADMVAGRYAIHFHHCGYGSKGSQVNGNVVSDCGNHSYVPHVSHGITMAHNVAYKCIEMSFWYDFGQMTHYLTWEHKIGRAHV